jgi:membrane associated rhomboid family serine protease
MARRGDDFGPTPQIAFPRLTPAVKVMLIGTIVLFVIELVDWRIRGGRFAMLEALALYPRLAAEGQLWRLLTWPLVQPPEVSGLLWACAGLYFFGTALEEDLGTKRFVLFTATAVFLSGLVAVAYGFVHSVFYTQPVIGVEPVGFALTTAWGTRFPHKRLLFPPVSARVFVFVLLGIAALSILAGSARQSPAASIGAIGIGWLMARYWDRFDDWLDRRRLGRLHQKRDRILRGIPGGRATSRESERGKGKPVDKRFLN